MVIGIWNEYIVVVFWTGKKITTKYALNIFVYLVRAEKVFWVRLQL